MRGVSANLVTDRIKGTISYEIDYCWRDPVVLIPYSVVNCLRKANLGEVMEAPSSIQCDSISCLAVQAAEDLRWDIPGPAAILGKAMMPVELFASCPDDMYITTLDCQNWTSKGIQMLASGFIFIDREG